jgi:hypothetical protein
MRFGAFFALAAVALLGAVPGCLSSPDAAGIPASTLESDHWALAQSQNQTQALVAKVLTREYQGQTVQSFGMLTVVSVTNVPYVTSQAVNSAADTALANANAQPAGNVTVDLSGAGAGKVQGTKFTVEKDNIPGTGFRVEFTCPNAYVLVVGVGANASSGLLGGGPSEFDNVVSMAKSITCTGG